MKNLHPLMWPPGWPRTPAGERLHGKFNARMSDVSSYLDAPEVSVDDGINRVAGSLARMAVRVDGVQITVDLQALAARRGMPVDEPGVAVYWRSDSGSRRVLAIDRYAGLAENLAAAAAVLENLRLVGVSAGDVVMEHLLGGLDADGGPVRHLRAARQSGQCDAEAWPRRQASSVTSEASPSARMRRSTK